ncbi:RAS1 protein [Balamuthia mandrillaris]
MNEHYRLMLLGAPEVGKTSLIEVLIQHTFARKYTPTIERDYKQTMTLNGDLVSLVIVDTAGHTAWRVPTEEVDQTTRKRIEKLRSADGVIIVYDITSRPSFERVKHFYEQLVAIKEVEHVPLAIVGTKNDLVDRRQVTQQEGVRLADSCSSAFLEVSATNLESTRAVFASVIKEIKAIETLRDLQAKEIDHFLLAGSSSSSTSTFSDVPSFLKTSRLGKKLTHKVLNHNNPNKKNPLEEMFASSPLPRTPSELEEMERRAGLNINNNVNNDNNHHKHHHHNGSLKERFFKHKKKSSKTNICLTDENEDFTPSSSSAPSSPRDKQTENGNDKNLPSLATTLASSSPILSSFSFSADNIPRVIPSPPLSYSSPSIGNSNNPPQVPPRPANVFPKALTPEQYQRLKEANQRKAQQHQQQQQLRKSPLQQQQHSTTTNEESIAKEEATTSARPQLPTGPKPILKPRVRTAVSATASCSSVQRVQPLLRPAPRPPPFRHIHSMDVMSTRSCAPSSSAPESPSSPSRSASTPHLSATRRRSYEDSEEQLRETQRQMAGSTSSVTTRLRRWNHVSKPSSLADIADRYRQCCMQQAESSSPTSSSPDHAATPSSSLSSSFDRSQALSYSLKALTLSPRFASASTTSISSSDTSTSSALSSSTCSASASSLSSSSSSSLASSPSLSQRIAAYKQQHQQQKKTSFQV